MANSLKNLHSHTKNLKKVTISAGLVFFMLISVMYSGCTTCRPVIVTPPQCGTTPRPLNRLQHDHHTLIPLTVPIIQRLMNYDPNFEYNLRNRYDILLFGEIRLERQYTYPAVYTTPSTFPYTDRETVIFRYDHIRRYITINDLAEARTIRAHSVGPEISLVVNFENENDPNYELRFSVIGWDAENPFFSLQYDQKRILTPATDVRGTIRYGGELYRVQYSGDQAPFLLINLIEIDEPVIHTRTVRGRPRQVRP